MSTQGHANRSKPFSSHSQTRALTPSSGSSSRPFLNMLNPNRTSHQGYIQANQSPLEEEDENLGGEREVDDDTEAGLGSRHVKGSSIFTSPSKPKAPGKRRISWGSPTAETNVLRPNIRQRDKIHSSDDDEVPQSFMIEASSRKSALAKGKARESDSDFNTSPRIRPLNSTVKRQIPPVLPTDNTHLSIPPRPSEVESELDAASSQRAGSSLGEPMQRQPKQTRGLDAYERALWNWVNVYNLDAFLQDVYLYYEGKGIYSMALSRGLNLLTVGFVIGFSTFLLGCVDYRRIKPEGRSKLSDVIVDRCVARFSGFTFVFFALFTTFYVWQIFSFVLAIFRLVDMYSFYTHLLGIPNEDIQTISWPEIVRRIGAIRESNPLTALSSKSSNPNATSNPTSAKLDAHDIANRIMRQENYLIALFNKELLDLRVPRPAIVKRIFGDGDGGGGAEMGRGRGSNVLGGGKGTVLTRTLEWNLRFCLMEFLFDEHGKVRKVFLKSKNRQALIQGLRRRLIFMGILNAIFAPFIVLYLLMYSFFRYFDEYHKNPSTISGRSYTPFAQWKFREFNELPHIFARRLDESHPVANIYIGQFPNENMTLVVRFVAFVAGSFAAVLFLASIVDPDLVLHFEITQHRTVLFYLGVFGSILAVARGMIPDDNRVFDPELLMTEVIGYTHYMPDEWKGLLHSKMVHQEFGQLFALKILIFGQEILSVVLTPFILWLSLPDCAPAIIDFFRDFSVHVEGRGYVCSFAEFNFQRHGNVKFGAPTQNNDARMVSKEGKMEKSFLNFKAANPDWTPTDPSGSLYLSRLANIQSNHPLSLARRRSAVGLDTTMTGTVILSEHHRPTDRAQAYDRALKQSQQAAAIRKRHGGGQGSGSILLGQASATGAAADPMAVSSIYNSQFVGGAAMAQTAVLGDSQGSIVGPTANAALIRSPSSPKPPLPTLSRSPRGSPSSPRTRPIPDDELALDGGVSSGLGGSYVDGGRRSKHDLQGETEDGEEGLEDGGVLGLLAQIYGGKGLHT